MAESGVTASGMAFLRVGSGRPLLFLPGLSADHALPHDRRRTMELRALRPFAGEREVWWVQRRQGLGSGTTMGDLALDYALLARERFGTPVDVVGVSTGGSVALQLALDHPDVVRRLLLVSAAYRLGDGGRESQRRVAHALRTGHYRHAGATVMETLGGGPLSRALLGSVGWVMGDAVMGRGDPDLLATIDAEDSFDVGDRLPTLACSMLVIGGARDAFYSPSLFVETARRAPHGRVEVYPGRGHLTTTMAFRFQPDVRRFLESG